MVLVLMLPSGLLAVGMSPPLGAVDAAGAAGEVEWLPECYLLFRLGIFFRFRCDRL